MCRDCPGLGGGPCHVNPLLLLPLLLLLLLDLTKRRPPPSTARTRRRLTRQLDTITALSDPARKLDMVKLKPLKSPISSAGPDTKRSLNLLLLVGLDTSCGAVP